MHLMQIAVESDAGLDKLETKPVVPRRTSPIFYDTYFMMQINASFVHFLPYRKTVLHHTKIVPWVKFFHKILARYQKGITGLVLVV